jgi:hypothetical protein
VTEEKTYPIYKVGWKWNQDNDQHDSTGFSKMFKEDPGLVRVTRLALAEWGRYIRKHKMYGQDCKLIDLHPQLIDLSVQYVEHETWCQGWFSHYTYNVDLSDEELLDSFARFVARKRPAVAEEKYCLMGAEDRWCWKGPCQCKHCIKRGVVSIDH